MNIRSCERANMKCLRYGNQHLIHIFCSNGLITITITTVSKREYSTATTQ